MAISDNIRAKALEIHNERLALAATDPHPIADEVKKRAIRVINGNAWDRLAYMKLFTDDPVELARLLPTDGTTDDVRNEARAYLVANGTCASGTGDKLLDNVTIKLDLETE